VADVEAVTDAIATEFDALVAALGLDAPLPASPPKAATITVADLMTAPVHTVSATTPLADAWGLMRRQRIRHLPVVDDIGRLVGLVTQRDLLGAAPSAVSEPDEAAGSDALVGSTRTRRWKRTLSWSRPTNLRLLPASGC
jgi:CBS-domain-containing membrane protein